MCGIFGHTGFHAENLETSRAALHTLAHRGPDAWGDWHGDGVYTGHRRLSIIDLSDAGRQPMQTEDGEVVLTFNGEIYNFQQLRRELEPKHTFRSHTDTEVLLHGYREWGIEGLLPRIEGIFAFVLYDRTNKTLYLTRDRVGVKPLYYGNVNGEFAWASELKALTAHFGAALDVDHSAVYDFLTYLYIPAPKSLYKNIHKLEPAHYLTVTLSTNTTSKHRYWQLNCRQTSIARDEAAEQLRDIIRRTVRDQMVSDVPVGFFLSGGLDSSAVVAEASQLSEQIHTYAIGFDVAEHNETHYARIVADHFHTRHEERILDESAAANLHEHMRTWFDEPFADFSALPTWLVSRFCRETATVALTGDGGDEVFGGYDWYIDYPVRHSRRLPALQPAQGLVSAIKNRNRHSLLGRAASRMEWRMLEDLAILSKHMVGMIKEDKRDYANAWEIPHDYDDYWYLRQYWREDLPMRTRLQYLDFHTILPDRFLTKVDRASMAVSLEARVPLLGTELVDFCFSLPEALLYDAGQLKGLFKYAYREVLPKEILNRGKKGFGIPQYGWRDLFTPNGRTMQEQTLQKLFSDSIPLPI